MAYSSPSREEAPAGADGRTLSWAALLRRDAGEWGLTALLFGVGLSMNALEPSKRYLTGEHQLATLRQPHQPNSVPSWLVLPIALLPTLATVVYLLHVRAVGRSDATRILLALLWACAATLFSTDVSKAIVGRPRPYFVERCLCAADADAAAFRACRATPAAQLGLPGVPQCLYDVPESRRSFPSGHASLTAAGCLFLTLLLLQRARPQSELHGGAAWRVAAAMTPLLLALLVCLTRIKDDAHHPGDVLAGALLGGFWAALAWRHVVWGARRGPPPAVGAGQTEPLVRASEGGEP